MSMNKTEINTIELFNEKYKPYLEPGHYGLAIGNPEFIIWLDTKFEEFTKNPQFSYSQIKSKFGHGRFYCEGVSTQDKMEVENKITNLYKH